MKSSIALSVFMAMISCFVAGCNNQDQESSRWLELPQHSKAGEKLYIDTTSIRNIGEDVMINIVFETDESSAASKVFTDNGHSALKDTTMVYQFNCYTRQGKPLHTTFLHVDGVSTSSSSNRDWTTVLPESRDETIMNYACDNRPKK